MSKKVDRFTRSRAALQAISTRTGTALPSLLTSFAVLHELSAILPIVGFFYTARTLGVGERIVATLDIEDGSDHDNWLKNKSKEWIREGEGWAQRIGKRYGFSGWEVSEKDSEPITGRLTGDLANAVVAYGATKALFPFRIGLSLYLSPAFSRRVVDPLSSIVMRVWRRRPS